MIHSVEIGVYFDEKDLKAAYRDFEAVLLKYGPEPAPHLIKEREAEIKRITKALSECLQTYVRNKPE